MHKTVTIINLIVQLKKTIILFCILPHPTKINFWLCHCQDNTQRASESILIMCDLHQAQHTGHKLILTWLQSNQLWIYSGLQQPPFEWGKKACRWQVLGKHCEMWARTPYIGGRNAMDLLWILHSVKMLSSRALWASSVLFFPKFTWAKWNKAVHLIWPALYWYFTVLFGKYWYSIVNNITNPI